MVKCLRLLKLFRLARASRLLRRFEARAAIPYGKLDLVKFFLILLLITHWLANLWALTLVLVDSRDGVPRWIDVFEEREVGVQEKTKDTPWKIYLHAIYFTSYTITSVGYGDIGPMNTVETFVVTLMILVAGVSWVVLLGQVCGVISHLNMEEQEFRTMMDDLNNMMADRLIARSMRLRLRDFFLSNKTARRRQRQRGLIEAMSPGLRGEVVLEGNKRWITKVSLLNNIMNDAQHIRDSGPFTNFVVEVSLNLTQLVHAQGEVFGRPHELYILVRGLCTQGPRIHRSGSVWGLDFLLADRWLLEPSSCLAMTYVELMTLRRKIFFELATKHGAESPELRQKIICCWMAFQKAILAEARRRGSLKSLGHSDRPSKFLDTRPLQLTLSRSRSLVSAGQPWSPQTPSLEIPREGGGGGGRPRVSPPLDASLGASSPFSSSGQHVVFFEDTLHADENFGHTNQVHSEMV
eukprot:CAMPEP_0206427390 /NCGR_PEP_ID=MMETSP0324_2-20121206/5005_1 /ASSEMBLY_ACC=CAM_ASM_000836 /TAXON_ID=2866 /ORGANISM="Crypthecodinium cohnii, Strain Seligo" /LENGTH=464 /DNA_ID=CAMNT_0053892647 /DNA_START=27 /DNA_END=1421 /DNA_ORIENTATION=-